MSNLKKILTFSILISALILAGVTGCQTAGQATATVTTTTTLPAVSDAAPLSFVEVVEKAKPSVVVVETDTAAGSGWIIDADGIIVTNHHVIEDAVNIYITLDDGRTFTAESVRSDPLTDIAIVYIDAHDLPAADVSDCCDLKVGQPVAAIGNALGRGISLKGGWISRLGVTVTVDGLTNYGLIETDAAINEGNSGGPLIDMNGEVIGITSIKLIDVSVEGVGYAISMDTALPIIEELISVGYVNYPFLGIGGLHTVDFFIASSFELDIDHGVLLTSVATGTPAEQAGLEPEDVITAIDDVAVNALEELVKIVRSKEVGQEIKITYWRNGSENTTYATLIEMPEE
ncbi:S1C family serine protease [Chloroflexota bacterium]